MPSHNAEGHQVWNPSVGKYFKPASNQRESYGGVVGALNDQLAAQGSVNKAYPHNFAGIISAIEDLTFTQKAPPVTPDVRPPGGDVGTDSEGNPEWVWATEPSNGELWYDTRQGRLFIAIDNEYYQTNGADGLAQVTQDSVAPLTPVIGQFWWDLSTKTLYIFDGFWFDEAGEVKGTHEPGYTPVWRVVTDAEGGGSTQTTATLPLADASNYSTLNFGTVLPTVDTSGWLVQRDINQYLFTAIQSLEAGIETGELERFEVTLDTASPAAPKAGDLWYDTANLELSIYYTDNLTSQWVPTNVNYNYDAKITVLESLIASERVERTAADTTLSSTITSTVANSTLVQELQTKLATVELEIAVRPILDASQFATTTSSTSLATRVTSLETAQPDYTLVQSQATADAQYLALTTAIASLATTTQLNAVIASIPSIAGLATTQNVTDAIANITTEYLPRTGGTLSGSFVAEKTDMSQATFDFSGQKWYGYNTHKYLTNAATPSYVTFGTTEKFNQYAWDFAANEDFSWVYNDSNKVFSITKEGPACSTLYVGDFSENDGTSRVILNKIDVKDRLIKYQTAFEQLRQGVSTSYDFDSLKATILTSLAIV